MEVHAHSHLASGETHSVPIAIGRKKWTHYLWEFLMLFLALFCGFLAENLREHKVEKNREKKFMKLLIQDVRFDTSRLKGVIVSRIFKSNIYDSLKILLNSDAKMHGNDIYYWARLATRTVDIRFTPADGTMQQLKNSGSLRLINNITIADSIIRYDVSVRTELARLQQELAHIEEFRKVSSHIFDARIFDEITGVSSITGNFSVLSKPSGNPEFSQDKERLFELYYWIHFMKGNNTIQIENDRRLLQQAENLLKVLQEEYKFNNN